MLWITDKTLLQKKHFVFQFATENFQENDRGKKFQNPEP